MYSGTVTSGEIAFAKLRERVPDLKPEELRLAALTVEELPCTAPWLSPYGACLINITDIRRGADGALEFQLADEKNVPYDGGNAWCKAGCFYSEWPQ